MVAEMEWTLLLLLLLTHQTVLVAKGVLLSNFMDASHVVVVIYVAVVVVVVVVIEAKRGIMDWEGWCCLLRSCCSKFLFDQKFTRRISPYAFLLTPIFDFPSFRKNCIPAPSNLQTFSFRGTPIATKVRLILSYKMSHLSPIEAFPLTRTWTYSTIISMRSYPSFISL